MKQPIKKSRTVAEKANNTRLDNISNLSQVENEAIVKPETNVSSQSRSEISYLSSSTIE